MEVDRVTLSGFTQAGFVETSSPRPVKINPFRVAKKHKRPSSKGIDDGPILK